MQKVRIYGLVDPRNDQLRYVGKTKHQLSRRLTQHMADARGQYKNYHSSNWMRSLLVKGLEPEIFLIESVARAEWEEAEQFWIAYFRYIGANLTNLTAGGEGHKAEGKKGITNHSAKIADGDVVSICEKYATGQYRQWQLAEAYGLSQAHVSHIIRGYHWKHLERPVTKHAPGGPGISRPHSDSSAYHTWGAGEEHPNSKLTDDKVRQIRDTYSTETIAQYELANHYGVSSPVIGKIVRGEAWVHVGGPITHRRWWQRNGKVNAAEVKTIRQLYSVGNVTYAELGKRYGVHKNTIGSIIRGETWRGI